MFGLVLFSSVFLENDLPTVKKDIQWILFLQNSFMNLMYFFLDILEMFYLNSTLNFGIPPVLLFQLEVHCKVDRLLNGLTAQQKRSNCPMGFK